jgi:putative component of membrane protein insertase Oxa1/YidC/SpoIIIJ protein YidD
MIDCLLIKSINLYQKWISPHKGYRCAYSAYYGGESCSSYGKRIIVEYGWLYFFKHFYGRLAECKYSSVMLNENSKNTDNEKENKQSDEYSNCNPVEEPVACCINIIPGK